MTGNDSYRNSIDDKLTTATTETQKLSQRLDVNDGKLTVATSETQKLHSRVDEIDGRVTELHDDVNKHTKLFAGVTDTFKAVSNKLNDHDEAFRLNNILLGLTMIIAIVGLFT